MLTRLLLQQAEIEMDDINNIPKIQIEIAPVPANENVSNNSFTYISM